MDWFVDKAVRFLFSIAMLFSVGLAGAFAYFETSSFPWVITLGAILGLAAFEAVKVTRASHVADLFSREQWGRLIANMILWLLLASFAFFMSFSAVNDHLFGVAVDKLGSEAQRVAQWQSEINEKKARRAEQVKRAGGEPKTEEAAKEDLETQMVANPKDWERSRQCELPLPETRSTCTKYKELKSALASSSAVAGLDREIADLNKKIDDASPEAREAAKAVSDQPRPRGLMALAMVLGRVDSKGADLSVAYLALLLAITAEFISNFLAYALEMKVPGTRATDRATSTEGDDGVSVDALPSEYPAAARKGDESSTPEGPKGPPNGGGKKPFRRPGSSPSVTPVKAGGTEGARLRLVKPSGSPSGALSVSPSLYPSVDAPSLPSGTESVSAFVESLPFDGTRVRSYGELATEYTLWCQDRGIEPIAVTSSSKLSPAFQALGFEKTKDSVGNSVYRDRRRAVAETA